MRRLALAAIWLVISTGTVGAFAEGTRPGLGFIGETGRILYFHVPLAWASFVGFVAAGVWSLLYLFGRRSPGRDRAAAMAVEVGLLFSVLATVSGAIWARVQWGAYWNWDPRQISISLALLFYGAYLALRGAVEDRETRARLAAAYAALGLVVAPFLFFVLPRMAAFTLHPEPVINPQGEIEMEGPMLAVLSLGFVGFTALYFWLHDLGCRIRALEEAS